MRRTEEPLTDMQVEKEIERLTKSDAVKLARQERRIKYRRRQYLYQLRDLEKRGIQLQKAGITNIEQLRVCEVAKIMHKHTDTIRYGLQQGVFPWGYAISTKNGRWSYFINKKRFEEIEGVTLSRGQA